MQNSCLVTIKVKCYGTVTYCYCYCKSDVKLLLAQAVAAWKCCLTILLSINKN